MKARWRTAWMLAGLWVLTLVAGTAVAQQDEGPILRPKPKPKPVAGATLLVMCDLACNWKLDGEAKGHIDAGGSAKAKVELGQHVLDAATEDGADKVKNDIEIKASGQTVVRIALQPVRDSRLKTEQEAQDKAAQEARLKAEQEQAAQEQAARDARLKAEQEQADRALVQAAGTWTDPATKLMWTKRDNGNDVTWQGAMDYCRNLQLADHSDWRLPTIDELQSIYNHRIDAPGQCCGGISVVMHLKGKLQLSGVEWSDSQQSASEQVWYFVFDKGNRYLDPPAYGGQKRALCVRRSR